LLSSEKRSLVRFLVIYLASTLLLFSLASWIFYSAVKHQILDQQQDTLKYESAHIISKLRILHQSNNSILYYPKHLQIDSAIYDLKKNYIFGSYQKAPLLNDYTNENVLYYITKIEPYYLGAAYLMTSRSIDNKPIKDLQKNILLFMFAAGIFFLILGYFLGRLFVAPMKESLERMNHFIQDTTHELNTPISTILTNIEMIETFGKHEEHRDELKRIEIASKTLSRIYDDLTYLNLNHQYHRHIVAINMGELVHERIVYFASMITAKDLMVTLNIKENVVLNMDKNDALRLVDNLISNAIKYNKYHGLLEITLTEFFLLVKDSGIGIRTEDLKYILERFKRANKSEGGFGIGLNIVHQVVESYDFTLDILSKVNHGTEVYVKWVK